MFKAYLIAEVNWTGNNGYGSISASGSAIKSQSGVNSWTNTISIYGGASAEMLGTLQLQPGTLTVSVTHQGTFNMRFAVFY